MESAASAGVLLCAQDGHGPTATVSHHNHRQVALIDLGQRKGHFIAFDVISICTPCLLVEAGVQKGRQVAIVRKIHARDLPSLLAQRSASPFQLPHSRKPL